MTTFFIADLHLCEQQAHTTQAFIDFCQHKARSARALYILGDLFEYWLGDDALDAVALTVQDQLQQLSTTGVALYYMAGNRDFLLGDDYANACGMTRLTEPHVCDLYGQRVLLVHGDAECTDDHAYQQTRQMLRNPTWQSQFLSQPIAARIEFAKQARAKSQQHTQASSNEIMDVNQQAITDLMQTHQVKTLIHGHTHRPAIHRQQNLTRIVLGDWHHQSSYLAVDKNQMQLVSA